MILTPLVCFGICLILIDGSIFQGFRDWLSEKEVNASKSTKWFHSKINQLFNCYMCLGFQVGMILGIFSGPFDHWNLLYNGAFYSALTWIIHCVVQYLGNGNDPTKSLIIQFPDVMKVQEVKSEDHINN